MGRKAAEIWKRFVFDRTFLEDIQCVCSERLPSGRIPGNFRIEVHREYCALIYPEGEKLMAAEILFIVAGRLWCAEKRKSMDQ